VDPLYQLHGWCLSCFSLICDRLLLCSIPQPILLWVQTQCQVNQRDRATLGKEVANQYIGRQIGILHSIVTTVLKTSLNLIYILRYNQQPRLRDRKPEEVLIVQFEHTDHLSMLPDIDSFLTATSTPAILL